MEETITRYQTEIEDLQKSRKEILRKAKEEAEQLMQEANARIENTIRTIKEAQAKRKRPVRHVRNWPISANQWRLLPQKSRKRRLPAK